MQGGNIHKNINLHNNFRGGSDLTPNPTLAPNPNEINVSISLLDGTVLPLLIINDNEKR